MAGTSKRSAYRAGARLANEYPPVVATVVVTPVLDQFDRSNAVTVNPDAVIVAPEGTETVPLRAVGAELGEGDAEPLGAGEGVGLGVDVGVGVTVGAGAGVGLAVRVAEGTGAGVGVGVPVGAGDGVALGVVDGVALVAADGAGLAVDVGELDCHASGPPTAADAGVVTASGTMSAATVDQTTARMARRTDDFTRIPPRKRGRARPSACPVQPGDGGTFPA